MVEDLRNGLRVRPIDQFVLHEWIAMAYSESVALPYTGQLVLFLNQSESGYFFILSKCSRITHLHILCAIFL